MPSFIMAMTINPHAKRDHPDLTHHVDESLKVFSDHQIHVERLFATLGRFDYLALFDVEDQTEAFKMASEINSKGLLETETWPVIPYDEFSKLIG